MKHHIVCVAESEEHAQEIFRTLKRDGVAEKDVSMWNSHEGGEDEFAERKRVRTGMQRFGGGLLTGIGPALLGGAGHFTGRRMMKGGELSGVLVRLGLSEHAAQHYENKVTEGGIVIAVRADKREAAKVVRNILDEAHGQEISEAPRRVDVR
jgi:Heat induced stress protein YflT